MQPMMFTGPTAVEISDSSIIGSHCLTALERKSEPITVHQRVWKAGNSTDDGVTQARPVVTHTKKCHDLDYNP